MKYTRYPLFYRMLLMSILLTHFITPAMAQQADSAYFTNLKKVNLAFNSYFNPHINDIFALPEQKFVAHIDSLRQTFSDVLQQHASHLSPLFVKKQQTDILFIFNKFILDYTPVHERITGQKVPLSKSTSDRLYKTDINDPAYLSSDAYTNFVNSLIQQKTDEVLHSGKYQRSTQQKLDAGIDVIRKTFINQQVQNHFLYNFMQQYIDNYGVKNISGKIDLFKKVCTDQQLTSRLQQLYDTASAARKDHLIQTYKTVAGYQLDAHIFMPDTILHKGPYPAIAFFHGGSWSEGKPDWFFSTCKEYAAVGWVAVAVEYRIYDRFGNLPPAAISDGKSLIRYLRTQTNRFHIAPNRIVAAGNSAGANLALTLAVINTLDEKTEDLRISSRPDALMLNSVAVDLTHGDWWQRYFKDTLFLQRISPLQQVRKNLPPILIIHGKRDNNVPVTPVQSFAVKMQAAGNDCELHVLDNAGHFIWYDPRFSDTVSHYRETFLQRLGYEPVKTKDK